MTIRKDATTPDDGQRYKCGTCGQLVSIDEISQMDGSDYQYWGTGMVCDDCLQGESSND